MDNDEYKESDIRDTTSIQGYLDSIENQKNKIILTSGEEMIGAILTAEQYDWFLEKIDEYLDLSEISKKTKDQDGTQSLDDFKKEIGE